MSAWSIRSFTTGTSLILDQCHHHILPRHSAYNMLISPPPPGFFLVSSVASNSPPMGLSWLPVATDTRRFIIQERGPKYGQPLIYIYIITLLQMNFVTLVCRCGEWGDEYTDVARLSVNSWTMLMAPLSPIIISAARRSAPMASCWLPGRKTGSLG
jgi:hypothetical protein